MRHPSTTEQAPVGTYEQIVGTSEAMRQVFRRLERVAQTDSTVLICGESGTGKELVAGAIHQASPRRSGPYVPVNMAAVPDTLIESELFGHVKGAFTDAANDREGRFEAAHTGTLFIDEIGELKLPLQAKLLRVLENHLVTPVGGNRTRSVDVRVIAATNRHLGAMVAEGTFREDLYYRLNVISITLPPLRDRVEDIPVLVDHFLDDICRGYQKSRPRIHRDLEHFFLTYAWPGNVRQLRNCVESMVVLADSDVLTLDQLPATIAAPPTRPSAFDLPSTVTLEEIEKAAVLQRLQKFHGNRTRAAQSLDISVRTLQRRLKRWGVADAHEKEDGDRADDSKAVLAGAS